jgi:hypothetical protein
VKRRHWRWRRWGQRLLREPVALSSAIMGGINAAVGFGLLSMDEHQMSTLNLALASMLGFFARTLVTPVANPRSPRGHRLVRAGTTPSTPARRRGDGRMHGEEPRAA